MKHTRNNDWDLLLGVIFFALVIFLYTLTPW